MKNFKNFTSEFILKRLISILALIFSANSKFNTGDKKERWNFVALSLSLIQNITDFIIVVINGYN